FSAPHASRTAGGLRLPAGRPWIRPARRTEMSVNNVRGFAIAIALLVIALAVRSLPKRQQLLGRVWGTAGAVVLRLVFIAIREQRGDQVCIAGPLSELRPNTIGINAKNCFGQCVATFHRPLMGRVRASNHLRNGTKKKKIHGIMRPALTS